MQHDFYINFTLVAFLAAKFYYYPRMKNGMLRQCLTAALVFSTVFCIQFKVQAQTLSPHEPGSSWPNWKLKDFQPNSPRFNETYGLDHFRGRVTFVALLATWCSFCRTQIEKMEEMQKEFADMRIEVNFVAINIASGVSEQNEFTSRCSFPLFQDSEAMDAFGLHKGGKDDYYIYNERGELSDFFPFQGHRESDLASPKGYANIKQAVLDAPYQSRLSVDTVPAVTIDGIKGRTYRIDYSEDLGKAKQWKTLETLKIDVDRFIYIDLEGTRMRKQRYYRIEEVP